MVTEERCNLTLILSEPLTVLKMIAVTTTE